MSLRLCCLMTLGLSIKGQLMSHMTILYVCKSPIRQQVTGAVSVVLADSHFNLP